MKSANPSQQFCRKSSFKNILQWKTNPPRRSTYPSQGPFSLKYQKYQFSVFFLAMETCFFLFNNFFFEINVLFLLDFHFFQCPIFLFFQGFTNKLFLAILVRFMANSSFFEAFSYISIPPTIQKIYF